MPYIKRLIDNILSERLDYAGAILLEGVKYCGKTETAKRLAKSIVRLDVDDGVKEIMATDPFLLLEGAKPRLLDEWQLYPQIWNYVKRSVDDASDKGLFILTSSANPTEDANQHSGVGRFSRLKMRPLSWLELGYSSGDVSLDTLLKKGTKISSTNIERNIAEIAEKITRGGWPENAQATTKNALQMVRDYVDLVAEVDLSRVSGQRRDPQKVKALLSSIARNIATDASMETLTADARRDSTTFDRDTASSYLSALERIWLVENLPAFNATLRSSATLRKTPKRHFVDPSIAMAALGENVDYLLSDIKYLGFLFESLVVHNLRVYADFLDAKVYFYRDSTGQEVDAIVQKRNGDWAAFEVKLGYGAVEEGAKSLLKFTSKINTEITKAPVSLNVITSSGIAHTRTDGVNVFPFGVLGV